MELQIEKLLEKYWNGETSLEEEKVIKNHFKSNPALTEDGRYFRFLAGQQKVRYEGKKSFRNHRAWLSAVATISIGLLTAALVFNDATKDPFAIEDPEKALRATKEALLMIGSELNEGQSHTLKLQKFNKAEEELKEDS